MMTSDVDTQGILPATGPMHLVGAVRVTLPSPLSLPLPLPQPPSSYGGGGATTTRPRLTLSAFRRPEHTVRLTQSDPSRRLESDYNLRSEGCGILGHGAFSTVRLARRRLDGLKVAIKSIAKHDALRARRLRRGARNHHKDEWEIMEQMKDHPHVVSLLDIFETNDQIHLVTEYCEGGELFDAIQKKRSRSPAVRRGHYSEAQAACITRQLLTALKDLHALRLIHRDVKPENICLRTNDSNIHAKLCDFGMARVFDQEGGSNSDTETPPSTPGRKHSFCAVSCDYYAAPEVCAMGSAQKPSADVYSLGVTLYILLCGFPPVLSDDLSGKGDYVLFPGVQWATVSECAKEFIRQMLHPDPNKRISAANALRNEWILRNGTPQRKAVATPTTTARRPTNASCAPAQTPASEPSLDGNLTEHVRSRLFQALSRLQEEPSSAAKRRGSDAIVSPRRKRRRGSMDCQRRSSIVCAMKELYCDMASVSAAASAAAAGVVCNEAKNDVHIFDAELGYEHPEADEQSSPFKPPKFTLSI